MTVVANVTAPRKIRPPPRGRITATRAGVEHRRDEVAEVLNVEALMSAEQVVEEPEREPRGEREDDEERADPRRPLEMRGHVHEVRHEPGERSPERNRDEADHRVDRQADGGELVHVLGRPPATGLGHEADDRRADAEIEQRHVDRDAADELPHPELARADRMQGDRRDDQPRDDGSSVDGVEPERVPAEEPHQTSAMTWKFGINDPGTGWRRLELRASSADPARLSSETGPRASTAAAQRDLDIDAEQHRERRRGARPWLDPQRRPALVLLQGSARTAVAAPRASSASSRPARGGRPAPRASTRGRAHPGRSRGAAHAPPGPGRRSARAPACRGRRRMSHLSTGSASTEPSRSAAGFSTTSTPTYSDATFAKKG